jgi:hypothetical protein
VKLTIGSRSYPLSSRMAMLLERIVHSGADDRLVQIHENIQARAADIRSIEIGTLEVPFDKGRVRATRVLRSFAPV